MEKKRKMETLFILYSHVTLYNLQHIPVLFRKMEAQKQILFHHELRIGNWSSLHGNRVTYIRNCV
jgi:hypothetical protein